MSYETLASVMTVVSFAVFIGIVWWALSGRRRDAFAQAAQLPFALPDEIAPARDEPTEWSKQ
jgi:cytochrome c oxidase cbb3-type subunit IV